MAAALSEPRKEPKSQHSSHSFGASKRAESRGGNGIFKNSILRASTLYIASMDAEKHYGMLRFF